MYVSVQWSKYWESVILDLPTVLTLLNRFLRNVDDLSSYLLDNTLHAKFHLGE